MQQRPSRLRAGFGVWSSRSSFRRCRGSLGITRRDGAGGATAHREVADDGHPPGLQRRDKIIELLRYPENSVGGVMTNDIAVVSAELTAGEAQERVNEQVKRLDFISLVFVVDEEPDGKLRGSVSLRDLLATDADKNLVDLMDPYVATLDPFESAGDAAYRIVSGQLQAMPVVNASGRLIGAMTISSAISQLVPASSGLQGVRVFS
jgi:CBS domain-containing protein